MIFQPMSFGSIVFLLLGALWLTSTLAFAFVPQFRQPSIMKGRHLLMSSATMEYNNRKLSFEDRMKNMVFRTSAASADKTLIHKDTAKLPFNIKIAKTLDDYKEIVGGETERIVVVRFFAPWCKVRLTIDIGAMCKNHLIRHAYTNLFGGISVCVSFHRLRSSWNLNSLFCIFSKKSTL
jgi:hypothetical protein